VNLIGEHTDYNDGFVLPMPIPQETKVELTPRDDLQVRGESVELGQSAEFTLGSEVKQGSWIDYVQGVMTALRAHGEHPVTGFELRVESNVPVGSGLSSSAALEVSLLRALREAFSLSLTDVDIAKIGQRAETDFVGAPIGIMDQMASSVGRPGSALFLDSRTLDYRTVQLPEDVELCVISSGITHAHGTSDYRTRRTECEYAAQMLGVNKLRDISPMDADLARIEALPSPLSKRARHVVTENARVLSAVEAIDAGNMFRLGRLFHESHLSMRHDFEMSIPEIDLLVELAESQPGVLGARLTGGGFGGSIVALTERGCAARAASDVARLYGAQTQGQARVLVP
jgi:galactokinase